MDMEIRSDLGDQASDCLETHALSHAGYRMDMGSGAWYSCDSADNLLKYPIIWIK